MESEKLSKGQIQVAATGCVSLLTLVGLMFYGLPFFFDFWVKDIGWSRATVTSGMAFSKVIIGPLFGFFAGWIIDRFGPRRLMLSGIVMGGIALIGLSVMTSLWQFYIFYLFNALGYMFGGPLPNQVLISRWFDKARGKAMGIAYLGVGFGGMLVPQIARWLNFKFGWHEALMILGVLMIVIAFPVAWFTKENPRGVVQQAKQDDSKIPFNTVLKSWPFYLLVIGSMCSIGAVAGNSPKFKFFFRIVLKLFHENAC